MGGAMRVQLAGRANAVHKAVPRAHPNHLDETLRAQRVVEHICVGAAIPPRPGSEWGPQPLMYGI